MGRSFAAVAVALNVVLLLAACQGGRPPAATRAPAPVAQPARAAPQAVVEARAATQWRAGAMVAAANPLAVEAGLQMLRAGGSAADAAIAVQAVLGLVEPQSSGIGGGAFMLHFDASTGDVVAYDGREVAPRGATPDMFLQGDGKPLPFFDAVKSGRSVGVPGVVAMLALAHARHGRLPWARGWDDAVRLAEAGFEVSPRLNALIAQASRMSSLAPDAARYLTIDGRTPLPVGHRLRNPDYAATLRRIAARGPRGFYEGEVASAIVAAARRSPLPGSLAIEDLGAYAASTHEPVCRAYRVYLLCGMGPPSSGGIAVLAVLGILENRDMSASGPDSVLGWHRFVEAQRLAYADRDVYVADDRFVEVPIEGLLDRGYLSTRAALISDERALPRVAAGDPPGARRLGRDGSGGTTGTSHFVIVDASGNVVSMTTTVESVFGSQRMAGGFFLNNQLTDFSFRVVDEAGLPIANAPAPGKKPRSSMSPTIVFENGSFRLAVGSPGGHAIIAYVSKALLGMLDWKLTPQQSVDLPNVVARGVVSPEQSRIAPGIVEGLQRLGHDVRQSGRGAEGSGLHAIMLMPDGTLRGAADPRREGVARAP